MDCTVVQQDKEKLVFVLKGINPAIANMIRRFSVNHVPTLAIEEVKIVKNSSALYDEIIAHRLGLIPLKTDAKTYVHKDDCSCKGKGCARCELVLSIKSKGPSIVTASEIESKDPKVKPAQDKMPIVQLLKDQEISMEMTAILGRGKEHIKFSPGLVYYKGYPTFETTSDSDIKKCVDECKGLLVQKGNSVEVKDILKWTEAQESMCEKNNMKVIPSKEDFVFYVESWGQLPAKQILATAISIFDKKLDEFGKLVKKLK